MASVPAKKFDKHLQEMKADDRKITSAGLLEAAHASHNSGVNRLDSDGPRPAPRILCRSAHELLHSARRERTMSDELEKLIEAARRVPPGPDDAEEHRRSFAFGNTHFENERITREHVDQAAEELQGEEDAQD